MNTSTKRFKLLLFTGGQIGWDLKTRAGRKKVALELGGNAACIVDADEGSKLDYVVERLVFSAFYQSGQSCIGVERILAHDDIYDALKKKLIAAVKKLKAGNPKRKDTFLGPMIDEAAAERLYRTSPKGRHAQLPIACGRVQSSTAKSRGASTTVLAAWSGQRRTAGEADTPSVMKRVFNGKLVQPSPRWRSTSASARR